MIHMQTDIDKINFMFVPTTHFNKFVNVSAYICVTIYSNKIGNKTYNKNRTIKLN